MKEKPSPDVQEQVLLETPKQLPADVLFNTFIRENNLELTFGPLNVRSLKDGSILVDKPPLTVRYKS